MVSTDRRSDGGDAAASPQRGISPFVCACFTLNYVVGTGFLTLPWAFERAGLVLSAIGMVVICFVANVASDYVLSAMARAEALDAYLEDHDVKGSDKIDVDNPAPRLQDQAVDESTALLHRAQPHAKSTSTESTDHDHDYDFHEPIDNFQGNEVGIIPTGSKVVMSFSMDCDCHGANDLDHEPNMKLLIKDRKYELTELCQIFLGDAGLHAYGIAVALDIYGFLWAYTSVFGTAMANVFPLWPDVDCYPFYVLLFALFVVPMSFMELSEQATVQIFLSGCRIVMILLMVVTPLVATAFGSGGLKEENPPIPHFSDQTEPVGAPLIELSNIHEMIPVIVFAVLFHQAIPGLADEMTQKSEVGTIFGYTIFLCAVAYSLIGFVVGWYFGDSTYESSNLNWEAYHAGTGQLVQSDDGEFVWLHVAWWARMISFFVVCFPAIDVLSAFPLYALVLGNSLLGMAYADTIQEAQHNRRFKTFFRALAAIPPIVGALFVRNLGIITDYSGLTGLCIAFSFPPLLYIYSEKKLKALHIPLRTRYERIGSSIGSAKAMFVFGVLTIVYCSILLAAYG
jgi:amino acid permease